MNRIPKNPDFPENTCRNLAISGQIQKNDRTSQGMAEERKIELIPESQIDGELDKKLRAFLSEIFPEWSEIFRIHRAWHEAVPVFSAVAFDSDRQIIGHVGVVIPTVERPGSENNYSKRLSVSPPSRDTLLRFCFAGNHWSRFIRQTAGSFLRTP